MSFASDHSEYHAQTFRNVVHKNGHVRSKEFHDCQFDHCAFNETVFEGCVFDGCTFQGCDLSLARVPGTAFSDTRFETSKLIGVNWADAGWGHKGLLKKKTVGFFDCALNYCVFMGLNLEGLELVQCVAREVNFEETNLAKADCSGTDFISSRFLRTDLSEADFSGATNYMIDVKVNTLHKTKFSLPEAMSLLYGLDIVLVD